MKSTRVARSECHRNPGLIHRAVHVFVLDGAGRIYLQKRAGSKDIQPGRWDTSVGGHLVPGESYEQGAAREMGRVIKPGGHLFVLDFSLPGNALVRAGYRFYLHRVMPAGGGLLTGKREAYEYLGGTIESFPSGKAMCALLDGCGFEETRCIPLSFGISSIYVARRSG